MQLECCKCARMRFHCANDLVWYCHRDARHISSSLGAVRTFSLCHWSAASNGGDARHGDREHSHRSQLLPVFPTRERAESARPTPCLSSNSRPYSTEGSDVTFTAARRDIRHPAQIKYNNSYILYQQAAPSITRAAMSSPNGLLSQKLCHYPNQVLAYLILANYM